ncbi:MAG: ABC transporter permease [Microthrixaceae bacterium]
MFAADASAGADPGVVGLAASGVLVLLAVGISAWRRLGLERSLLWAAVRALVQLLLIGLALALVVEPGRPLALSWLWVAVMVVFAAWTLQQRAPEVPGALPLGVAAFGLSCLVTLGVLFGFGIFELGPRTVVPLAGMVVGNSLAATVLVGRRIVAEATDKRPEIEARLSLGMTGTEALRPHVRDAVRTALVPQIETTKAVGIVFLPGAMVGLILAGVAPITAVKVQAAVMYLILGSVATTTTVVAIGLSRRLMTPDHRLVRLPDRRA